MASQRKRDTIESEGDDMEFKKAVRQQAKLRLALSGPSGSGKTWGALKIAKGLGGRIAVIDTEEGSASLYSHLVEFDTLNLGPPYKSERFIEAIQSAEKAGYDIIIIDSITHEWNGSGGCLESNDRLAQAKFKGNTWAAWNETTPRHQKFIDAMLQSRCHLIATMRAKTDTVQENGRVKKLGMKDEQRDGTDYLFTTVLNIIHEGHHATAAKDRTELFFEPHVISEETGRRLKQWLMSGAPMKALPPDNPEIDAALASKEAFGDVVKRSGINYAALVAMVCVEFNTNYTVNDKMSDQHKRWAAGKCLDAIKAKKATVAGQAEPGADEPGDAEAVA